MNEDRTSDGRGASERFSTGAKHVLALQTARTGLSMNLDTVRQLLEPEEPRQRKTAEIKEAERRLDETQRQRAEAAARVIGLEVSKLLAPIISELASSGLAPEDNERRWFPHAEELAVFAFDRLAPSTVSSVDTRLLELCENDYAVFEYALLLFRWQHGPTPGEVLRTGLVTSLVRAFEELLAALFRRWRLTQAPSTGPAADAASQLRDAAAFATKMLKKGRRDWSSWFARELDLDLSKVVPDCWPSAREVLARRNVIEHNAGRADREYLDVLDDMGDLPALGAWLECDSSYVEQSIASLEAVADVLTVGFGTCLAPAAAELAKLSEEPVYRALRAQRYLAARWMGTRALAALEVGHAHNELMVNVWMARQELGEEAVREEVEAWVPPRDDAGCQLAKAALLDDVRDALAALRRAAGDNPRELRRVKEWPLVQRLEGRSKTFETELRLALSRAPHTSSAGARTRGERGRRA